MDVLTQLTNNQWNISLVETGLESNTALRLKKIKRFIGNERILVTYGDGLSDININDLISFHELHKKIATLTAVQPISRFGSLTLTSKNKISKFEEKQKIKDWVNGGFFIFEPKVFDYFKEDEPLEQGPINNLVKDEQIFAFKHHGFWQPMDTYRESLMLNKIWSTGKAPWKNWD